LRSTFRVALVLLALLALLQAPSGLATAPALPDLESLHYRVDLPVWHDAARVNLTLKQLGPGHYLGEATGTVQGPWRLLCNWLPVQYQTEMVYRQGRLQPLVYREQFRQNGKQVSKEFRFDYDAGQLILHRRVQGRAPDKEWRTPLKDPIYDPLTLCYNLRLGAFGPMHPGETLTLAGIPYPKPNQVILSVGPNREVMVTIKEKTDSAGDVPPLFLSFDPQWVPTLAWTRMPILGRVVGLLVETKRGNGALAASLGGMGPGTPQTP
jgi:hypothetical protein